MILHKNCGGRLVVKDTTQEVDNNGIHIQRARKCDKCGFVVYSTEKVTDAMIREGYKHKR